MKKTARKTPEKSRPIYPPPVKKGETIGLVAPAGSLISRENFLKGVSILEKKGFRIKFNQSLLNAKGYLAGSDGERTDDFNRLWRDPEVTGIVAARGGFGCLRMVGGIDMKQIRRSPKILIGFSDLTVLLNAIHKKTGLVTFHGPVVTTLATIDAASRKNFFRVLETGRQDEEVAPARIKTLRHGKARGRLFGGNLATLAHMVGTPYDIPWDKAILFIEDIGEQPYRLDRFLTHLYLAKRLQKVKGLILGTFTDDNNRETALLRRTVTERIAELLQDTDIPIWAGFPTGHSRRNLTLPVGTEVKMDTFAETLSILA